ncbi:hypothetical protein HOG47_05320, partial [archaeon]|nr:hypothetical protein [archaeon]
MTKNYTTLLLKKSLFLYILRTVPLFIFAYLTYTYKTFLFFPLMIIIPFAFVYFLPQIYKPFNKFKPYHGKYRTKIFDLAKEHDVKIKEIVSSKTGFSGAALGLWNNQVIFINSRILKQPWEEIKSLYLHEFAHFKNKDLE